MPSTSSRPQPSPLPYGTLAPFGLLALGGLLILTAWWTGQVNLVQPRPYDAALPANAAACLLLIGLAQCAFSLQWRRTGLSLGSLASLLGLVTLLQDTLGLDWGVDNLLTHHEVLVAGPGVARMPAALALVCTLSGLLVTWLAARPKQEKLPVLLGLLGSLVLAYAITGLLAYRNGLNAVAAWQEYARLGPHSALLLLLLGSALILLAARAQPAAGIGPRWLWLPVTVCGITLTLTFWVSLRQRELSYLHSTTQLTMDYIAALFSREAEGQIGALSRLARRTGTPAGSEQETWQRDAAELVKSFPGYRSIQLTDSLLLTRWYWPLAGNEDAPSYDHGSDPLRRAALKAAHQRAAPAVAAPLEQPGRAPTFAVYLPVVASGGPEGFIVGEFYYDRFFESIDRRLTLSARYQTTVAVEPPGNRLDEAAAVPVYQTAAGQDQPDPRLRRTAHYEIYEQQLIITLTPRPGFVGANRPYLPELTLFFGVGVSILLGLVTNLAQTALRRQRAAETTSRQLRLENEERRRIEARLKTADERLNLAFESTQAGVFEWDVESDQVYCTPSVWKMIGADPADMPATGTGWLNLLHPDDRPAVRAVIDAHFRHETPLIEIEHCVHLRSGDWLWIAFRAKCTSFSAARHPRRVLGTVHNINARKRADEALRLSQAESRKLSLVASKTDNAVVISDATGHIEWVNESFTRLTGRPLADAVRRPLLEHIAGTDEDPAAPDRLMAALAAGTALSTDAVQLTADGGRVHIHLELQPVIGDEGFLENFIAISTNISARIETEHQLRRAKEEADAASRAKSEFLASMSHEIRTPMNGVIGMTSLLLDTDLNAEQRDYVSTIRTSGDALLSIINEILDFSKIESGRMELEHQPFELAQCVEEAVDIFSAQAAAKNIELAYFLDPAVPPCILGDITRLRQVLVNLMNNAIKFTPSGFVTIEVGVIADNPANPAAGNLLIDFYVSDTGIGIPADRQHLLFQPFSQVDSSTTRKFGGTGLGLAICHRLCEMMGGSIDVESVPGQGSRFHFCIQTTAVPITDGNTPPLFPPLPATGAVLAVDDHPVNRTALRHLLEGWALRPLLAATPDEAMSVIRDQPLAAAIVDQDLAGVSGVSLIPRLRALQPNLPIIMLVPAHGSPKRDESFDSLVFRLPKPIKPYPLHDALRRATQAAGAGVTAGASDLAGTAIRLAEAIPLSILLVEDNPVNQKVALGYLARLGYQPDAVSNGREAVEAVTSRPFDLVFMDLQMPVMDGLEATRAMRAALPPDRLPLIVALTANAMPGDRETCLAAGMNDYLSKPVKIEELQTMIQRHFGHRTG
ncbi:Signal transduction histidine-protein kinase BarA [Lacunisphaera limnophila]|uniref:Sensory/regulatory protein RpfC n=1 Tax=Lacunisphaera limnophila TaxID=1838286 RepID=A0A1I7PHL3_9BACT|nr:response regulator [Lacunisphaera limnophila]AOS43099.1 Signal transduction histidine-protein kinase BarA [Lacunisphaera limnophila]